jgi:hypothetical protein
MEAAKDLVDPSRVTRRQESKERAKAASKKWKAENPHKAWSQQLWFKYKMLPADFDRMIAHQSGACNLCKKLFSGVPDVDHDHSSGVVRSLLCRRCNLGLGMFLDDSSLLWEAAKYLIGHRRKI